MLYLSLVIILLILVIVFLIAKIRSYKNNTPPILSKNYLDMIANVNYNINRIPGESDSELRERIINSFKFEGKP